MPFRLNPAWCATARLSHPDAPLRVDDMALLLTVVGHLSTRTPGTTTASAFERNIEACASPSPSRDVERFDVEVDVSQARHDLDMRTRADVVASAQRLRRVLNRDARMFETVATTDDVLTFRLAFGPAALHAHPHFARRMTSLPGRRGGDAAYADRSYTPVDPARVSAFKSPSSVHPYLRLRTWLSSPCRDGLPHLSSYTFDKTGVFKFEAPAPQMAERLGVEVARTKSSYIAAAFTRIARDLMRADIALAFNPATKQLGNACLRAGLVSRLTDVDHEYHRALDVVGVNDAPPPSFRRSAERAVDTTLVGAPPRVTGRVNLKGTMPALAPSHITSTDHVVPAQDDTLDDVLAHEPVPPGAILPDPTPDPVPVALVPTHTTPVQGSPTRYGHGYERHIAVPLVDGRLPTTDEGGFELADEKRPHPEPVYGDDHRDQHGYDREGFDREDKHWYTGLKSDELPNGHGGVVKKPGVDAGVRHVGLPPTDRDRWVESPKHPVRPPAETPWWCSTPGLWMSQPHDSNWSSRVFPLHVWGRGNRHDRDVRRIDDATLEVVRDLTPVATQVADWPAILAYVADIRVWARERPDDLGDLPSWYVIAPGYDLAEVMSHCERDL